METKKRSGRPRKADHEKVQYQLIAVYAQDYLRLVDEINKRGGKIAHVFAEMVEDYCENN